MNSTPDPWAAAPPEVQACRQRLRSLVPHLVARVRPHAALATCGFDSLELVELLCAVEAACGVRLAVDEADERTTGLELFTLIARRSLPAHSNPVLP